MNTYFSNVECMIGGLFRGSHLYKAGMQPEKYVFIPQHCSESKIYLYFEPEKTAKNAKTPNAPKPP